MLNEPDIIYQLKKGDQNALAQIMSAHKLYVYNILKAMLTHQEAQEATQDTFIKIFKSINQYNQQSKFTTWIYSIAYRTGLDYIRKRRNFDSLDTIVTPPVSQSDILENMEKKSVRKWIEGQIDQLAPEDAALIKLYYFQEMSISEVAESTGLSESNIKVRLFRVRKTLKSQFGQLRLSDIVS